MNTGMFYLDPNLLGRRYLLSVSGDALFRRETKAYDGFTTTVQFSRPLYRLSQPNGFSTWLSWTQGRGQEPTAYDDRKHRTLKAFLDSGVMTSPAQDSIGLGSGVVSSSCVTP